MARSRQPPSGRLILDSGAVTGWSRGDPRVRALLRQALERNLELRVPVVVLAETLRGGARDAPVNRVLKATGTHATEADIGRRAGALLGTTKGHNVADALVAAESMAAAPGSAVLTSDPDDLSALLTESGVTVLRA